MLLKGSDVMPTEKGSNVNRCSCCREPLKGRNSKKHARNPLLKATLLSNASTSSTRTLIRTLRNEETRNPELPHIQYTELKLQDADSELQEDETGVNSEVREDIKAAIVPLLPDSQDISEDACRTPSFFKSNKFFGIPLTNSPRWANRLVKKTQLEKEFFADINETNAAAEAESETLNRLKRQVRLDRKSLIELYMELDEERSASAVAANNAMAMITRLQAEKAAMQMEDLQYQRMMDEQAEYDQEAMQFMKDVIGKREDEIKILEADLEVYRERYGPLNKVTSEDSDVDADEEYQELKSQSSSSFSEKSESGSPKDDGGRIIDEPSFDFEGEHSYFT